MSGPERSGATTELMTTEEEDFAEMLDDLFADDGAMQTTFRTAVEQLAKPTAAGTDGSDTGGGEHDKDKTARETLLAMLPASEQEVRIAELEESVAQKDEELAANAKERAANAKELAAKDKELVLLRERLASFEREAEAEPPQA